MDSRQLWTLTFFYLTAVLCRPTNGVTLQMPSSSPYLGDSVTVRCVGSDIERVNLLKDDTEVQRDSTHQINQTVNSVELRISPVSAEDQGLYSCVGNKNISLDQKPLNVTGRRRSIWLSPSSTVIPDQGSVTLSCSVEDYLNPQWFRRSSESDTHSEILKENTYTIRVSRGGVYSCRGSDEFIVTEESDKVTIWENGLPLKIPSWANYGETVIAQCEGPVKTHLYFYKDGVIVKNDTNHWFKRTSETTVELRIHVSASNEGWYSCGIKEGTLYNGHQFLRMYPGWSPRVKLTTESHLIPNQSTVELKCEAQRVYGYEWIRRSSVQNSALEILKEDTPTVTVSRGGVYSCSGKIRRNTLTAESDRVTIWETDSVILLIPARPVPEGRSVSLTCKLEPSAELSSVRFYKDGQLIQEGPLITYSISALSKSDEGLYNCSLQTSNQVMTSPESWLSVGSSEQSRSSVLMLVLVGAVSLIVFLILLLLLWRCKNRDSCFVRSQETVPPEETTYTELQRRDEEDVYETIQQQEQVYDDIQQQQMVSSKEARKEKATEYFKD